MTYCDDVRYLMCRVVLPKFSMPGNGKSLCHNQCFIVTMTCKSLPLHILTSLLNTNIYLNAYRLFIYDLQWLVISKQNMGSNMNYTLTVVSLLTRDIEIHSNSFWVVKFVNEISTLFLCLQKAFLPVRVSLV